MRTRSLPRWETGQESTRHPPHTRLSESSPRQGTETAGSGQSQGRPVTEKQVGEDTGLCSPGVRLEVPGWL